jgi:transitional endoplasmic reticulum ATPase
VLSQFLAEMDGIEELKGVLILAATNRADMLDPAVLRTGRFDEHFEILAPDQKDREEIFAVHLKNKPLVKQVDIKTLASKTDGFAGADIAGVCNQAALKAVRRAVQKIRKNPEKSVKAELTEEDLNEAIDEAAA